MSQNSETVKLEFNDISNKESIEMSGGSDKCKTNPANIFSLRKPTAQEVVDYFKQCKDIIQVFNYLHKEMKMPLIDIFELCIRSGYTSNQFSSFEGDIWYKMAEVRGGYDFFPFIQIMHEIGNYTIKQIKETGIGDIVKYFDDWKKYNIESAFTEREIFANSSAKLQYVNGYSVEKILGYADYPNDALPEIIEFGIKKKGLSLEDFLKKDKFSSKFGPLYMDLINKKYGTEGKPGYVRLFEEAKRDIESGSVKFGYDDISWMRSLESEKFVRFNYPQIADEIFGKQKGGEYKINYTI